MKTDILNNKFRWFAITASILFHVILGVMFYFLKVHQRIIIPEFAEMVMPTSYIPEITDENMEESVSQNSETIKNVLPQNIELPEKIVLKDADKIKRFKHKKKVEDLKPISTNRQKFESSILKAGKDIQQEPAFTKKQTPNFGFSKPTLKPADDISGAGTEVEKVFTIEWEGDFKREILYETLPDISNITAHEAEIKLVFYVEPDGTISSVQPLQKGGMIQLENATIEALKKWRFNPISTNAGTSIQNKQNRQKGIISFKFISR